jgi:hypothetical protein
MRAGYEPFFFAHAFSAISTHTSFSVALRVVCRKRRHDHAAGMHTNHRTHTRAHQQHLAEERHELAVGRAARDLVIDHDGLPSALEKELDTVAAAATAAMGAGGYCGLWVGPRVAPR